jgi:hypothetical protein
VGLFDRDREESVAGREDGRGLGTAFSRIRRGLGTAFSRIVATGGIIGAGTGAAAIMGSQDVAYWIIGIVVSGLSVLIAAIVWSSRSS